MAKEDHLNLYKNPPKIPNIIYKFNKYLFIYKGFFFFFFFAEIEKINPKTHMEPQGTQITKTIFKNNSSVFRERKNLSDATNY